MTNSKVGNQNVIKVCTNKKRGQLMQVGPKVMNAWIINNNFHIIHSSLDLEKNSYLLSYSLIYTNDKAISKWIFLIFV
jgi:hypothetical protein